MNVKESQQDLRSAYVNGIAGVIVSGLVWLVAGIMAYSASAKISMIVFFVGGMLIHPLGIFISKMMKGSGQHKKQNLLGILAMESTIFLFAGLFIAYAVSTIQQNWFFHIMLIIIGARYVIFQSMYGIYIYWIFGLTLLVIGAACLISDQAIYISALLGGVLELIFGFLIYKDSGSK